MIPVQNPARVFWLFGLSGAGKSTLANSLAISLRNTGRGVLALDGDDLRAGLCQGLGFSDDDRAENLRRAAETAKLGLQSGLCVVAAFITPLERHRQLVAGLLDPHVSFIHVNAPLNVCRLRDVKGLYAGALAGKVAQLTGVTSDFELPARTDLILHTDREDVPTSTGRLLDFVRTIPST